MANYKFTLTNRSNQNIKLIVEISNFDNKNNNLITYSYNKKSICKYNLNIKNSSLNLYIYFIDNSFLNLNLIGSFIYDKVIKYLPNKIEFKYSDNTIFNLIIFGFYRKNFLFDKYISNKKLDNKFILNKILSKRNQNLLDSINFLKILVSEPSNIIYPESFVKFTLKNLNKKNIKIKVLDRKKITKIGLNCLLAVNQGSNKEPRVVEFYNGPKKNVDILFVGKGVCFDSGGISIKPSSGMEDMKWDMAGAAVVASIMKYLSNKKTNLNYAGIVGLVENMPSATAYKPGDIIKSYNGINVEVLNTDAEGRLVLADIISYGCEVYKPKIVIDFATLTGAIMIALGQHYAGLYSNDDKVAAHLYESGMATNEKLWRMPLHDDFDKELNSPFVDVKNITNSRYGGSITAAQFLQRFVPKNTKWAHLDIAGVTWKPNGDIMNNKGATGFGLTLIADFIDKYF